MKTHPISAFVFTLLTPFSLLADITYVDAVEGPGGNTFATGLPLEDTSWESGSNDSSFNQTQWTKRTNVGGDGDSLFQVSQSLPDTIPQLTTRLEGLAPGTYDIWVFYWDQVTSNSQNWTATAGLSENSLISFSSPEEPEVDGTTKSLVMNASELTFTNPVTVVEGEGLRNLFGVKIGKATVTAGTPAIEVYLDHYLGNGSSNRTWYDGVGYELTSGITYLDAVEGPGGNTRATGSASDDLSWLDGDNSPSANDNQWKIRTFGNNETLLQALPQGDPSGIPELTTTISGLANGTYEIWAFFQDNVGDQSAPIQDWVISAGLTSGSLDNYHALGQGPVAGATSDRVWDAGNLAFANPVVVVEGDGTGERHLFGVNLGTASVSGGSDIEVFIGMNLPGSGNITRVWFDGVGYASTTPTSGLDLAVTSFIELGEGLWELEFRCRSNTTYLVRSSPSLDFDSGEPVEGLTQEIPEETGTIGGDNNELISTDDAGLARVQLALGGNAVNFIRVEIAP